MLDLLAARTIEQAAEQPVGTEPMSAAPHAVAILATTPALRAGLESMLGRVPGVSPLSIVELNAGVLPVVVLIESRSWDQVMDLIDEWPTSALLFVGEPSPEALRNNVDRVAGAVSTDVDPKQLGAAIGALASGLRVFDPVLSERTANALQDREPTDDAPNPLTPRERQVLELVARGYPNKSIAYELGISEHTAKFHVGSLLTKLDAASRAEVVTNATRRGLLTV